MTRSSAKLAPVVALGVAGMLAAACAADPTLVESGAVVEVPVAAPPPAAPMAPPATNTTAAATGAVPVDPVPSTTASTAPPPLDLYAHTRPGMFAPQVQGITPRVYVPNSDAHSLTVIDPATGAVNHEVIAAEKSHVELAISTGREAAAKASWRNMLPPQQIGRAHV